MPCFCSLSKLMRKKAIMRATCGSVYVCVWSCACVCLQPLRYQAIAHLSMTAQLCQHRFGVFLSILIHIIMNDVMQWQKHYIYLNCSPTLFCLSLGSVTLCTSLKNGLCPTKTINMQFFFIAAVNIGCV